MNLTPGKILLGLSMAAYAYCSWDHILPGKKPDPVASKPLTLTAAMVNHVEKLSLGRDAFESKQIDRGTGDAAALPDDDAANPGTAAASAADAATATALASPGVFSLQGVFMTPEGHAALINGTPVTEGELTMIGAGGPKILATRIGEDYAIIEWRGRTEVLKLSDPRLADSTGGGSSSSGSDGGSTSARSPGSSPGATGSHGGGTDPYAGHRTGHH